MKFEPPIDHVALLAAVRTAYGLPARALTFVPVGFASACYTLDCADQSRSFLKLWPGLRLGEPPAVRLHATLVLTRALYDRELYPHVPYPIPTRHGALWADLAGVPFAIAPFLPGSAPPDPLPPALYEELGRAIAAIHRATPDLSDVLPPPETFDLAFEPVLQEGLDAATRIGRQARPGLRAFRDWLLPRQHAIESRLSQLHGVQTRVRRLDGPSVLCHTDIHAENVLVDDQGGLSILDWDGAVVAPPEHDLQSGAGDAFGGEGFAPLLRAYRDAGGAAPLSLDHFAFYLMRRYLEDLTARVERILAPDADPHADDDLLYGMEAYGFAPWATLDRELEQIAAALARHSA